MSNELVYPLDTSEFEAFTRSIPASTVFLATLNRHFIQLISCGDDYQFQELIKTFLPVLIRSIETQTDDFRKKVSVH
jgi:hypothetical protein